jgi:hypothetical protein
MGTPSKQSVEVNHILFAIFAHRQVQIAVAVHIAKRHAECVILRRTTEVNRIGQRKTKSITSDFWYTTAGRYDYLRQGRGRRSPRSNRTYCCGLPI